MINIFWKDMQQNKEPWYAVCLSWLIPGTGQIYAGKRVRGGLILLFTGICYIILFASWLLPQIPIYLAFPISIGCLLGLRILISIDAFKATQKSNASEFEIKRKSGKDPWLSVFLSLLLPGLGHAYIRRWFFLLLYFSTLFVIEGLSSRNAYIFMIIPLFYIGVCFHAYFATTNCWRLKKHIIVLFIILLIGGYTSGSLLQWIVNEKFVTITNPGTGPSMEPTLTASDRMIVNMFTYMWTNPKIGDIVIIRYPKDFQPPKQYQNLVRPVLEKRVIAIEGESVQVIDSTILVNGVERRFDNIKEHDNDSDGKIMSNEYLKVGVTEPYVVPKGCYFVLGDNINSSIDSRFFGAFPKKTIIGKVVKICWPPNRVRNFD